MKLKDNGFNIVKKGLKNGIAATLPRINTDTKLFKIQVLTIIAEDKERMKRDLVITRHIRAKTKSNDINIWERTPISNENTTRSV